MIKTWEIYHSLIEEIMISNEIEGVVSTKKEITELINIEKPKEYKRFYGMVKKYEDIFFQENANVFLLFFRRFIWLIKVKERANYPNW